MSDELTVYDDVTECPSCTPAPHVPGSPTSRVTVVCSFYHQPAGGQPKSFDCRWSSPSWEDNEPFQRTLKATAAWKQLAPGNWVENAGVVVVRNEERPSANPSRHPTLEDREKDEGRTLEVSPEGRTDGGVWLVPPGEHLSGRFPVVGNLKVRCRSGEVKYTVAVNPG